jgi:hypothetical protein
VPLNSFFIFLFLVILVESETCVKEKMSGSPAHSHAAAGPSGNASNGQLDSGAPKSIFCKKTVDEVTKALNLPQHGGWDPRQTKDWDRSPYPHQTLMRIKKCVRLNVECLCCAIDYR